MRLGPTQTETQTQAALPCGGVLRAWIVGHIQARNTDGPGCSSHIHQLIQNDRRLLHATLTLGFKAYTVDCAVHLGHAQNLLHVLRQRPVPIQIDCFTSERTGLQQPPCAEVHDHDDRRAE